MPLNTGVIIEIRPKDFVAGSETGAVPVALDAGAQYDLFLPDEETQYRNLEDVFACVSFSALNNLEIIFNYKLSHNLFSKANAQWLIDNGYVDHMTGKVNFSDRYIAKLSGTTQNGNSLGAVGDAIINNGLVPEALWPWPVEMTDAMTPDQKWNLYYATVPASVQALGAQFKARFSPSYQWISINSNATPATLKSFLVNGPFQVATAICSPWNSNEANPPINGCGCGTQHATTIYGFNDGVAWKDFDSYKSYRKLLAWNYCLTYAVQYYVVEKVSPAPSTKPTAPAPSIVYGAPDSASVRQLQSCLQYLGYMTPGVFGPFGPQTRVALAKLQLAHGIPDAPQGTNYGPKSAVAVALDLSKK